MYFIEEGNVSIRITQDGGEVEISNLKKGQYFGELALVTHRPRAASAYAADNVKVACKYRYYYFLFACIRFAVWPKQYDLLSLSFLRSHAACVFPAYFLNLFKKISDNLT